MKFSSSFFLTLFALVSTITAGQPTCQAVKGAYTDATGASAFSVPAVSLDVLYQLQVPSSSDEKFFNLLFDASQERVANALVSTLFESCRDDSSSTTTDDAAETVNLQTLTVDFGNNDPENVPKERCGDEFECYTLTVSILAMSARAAAPAEMALAVMHLEDSVQRAIREHSPLDVHDVATLRFQEFVKQNNNQDEHKEKKRSSNKEANSQRLPTKWILLVIVGSSLLVLFVAGRSQRAKGLRWRSHHYSSDLSLQNNLNQLPSDNMEMASYKPSTKQQQQDLDETENSESFSDEEDFVITQVEEV